MKYASVLFAIATLFIGSLAEAATLGETLHLPAYLQKHFGNTRIVERHGEKFALRFDSGVRNIGPASKDHVIKRAATIHLSAPVNMNIGQRRYALGKNLLDLLRSEDPQIEHSLADLENIRIGDPAKGDSSANLAERIRLAFATKVTTAKPSKDRVANLWYSLKFESQDPYTYDNELKVGEPVLVLLHQSGYYVKSGNPVMDLLSRIDFGHSALGIRYFGMDSIKDLLINPGSKNRQSFEVGLPFSANPDVLNLVDVDNLWRWTETQIRLRYMKVRLRFLPLTPDQIRALPVLIPTVNGVNFGPAVATTNNCADGAAALVNFLMPIHRTFSAKLIMGLAVPARLTRLAANRVRGSDEFTFPNLHGQAPGGQTPGVSYKKQQFRESELSTFRDYLNFEAKF